MSKKKLVIAGMRIDYLRTAVRALREVAHDAQGRSQEPRLIVAEETYEWEAAEAIDQAIQDAQRAAGRRVTKT